MSEISSRIEALLERMKAGTNAGGATFVRRFEAPRGIGATLFADVRTEYGVYFREADDDVTWVGLGAHTLVRTTGVHRFAEATERINQAFESLEGATEKLRFFGGAAFAPGRDGSGCWANFGDCTFLLPLLLYVDAADGAVIFALGEHENLEALVGEFANARAKSPPAPTPLTTEEDRTESFDESAFETLISAIKSSIEHGDVEKVVAARRTTLKLSGTPRLDDVLGRLDEAAADCHRFAFRIGTRTFVGATPETLVRKRGIRLDTEALAGSRPRSLAGAEIELLESDKDRLEHKLVVDSIVSTIAPISSELEHLPTPVVRRLRRIIHLHTPITATLRAPLDVLEVVALLHPTPAVGGFPRNAALAWLEKNEAVERGWYASPFGFVTRGGDGHFVVALRSALVNGDRVHLFAGAGIVDRSNPAEEFAETELKMTAMRSALGLPEPAHDAL